MPKRRAVRLYVILGIIAIIAGGALSAFSARYPSTFAMWASAYLVLVAGVVQVFFGLALERLAVNNRLNYVTFGLFVAGNILVIAGSAVKYAGLSWNMPVTIAGSVLLIATLALLGWTIRNAKRSFLKLSVYTVVICLAISIPTGLILAQQ